MDQELLRLCITKLVPIGILTGVYLFKSKLKGFWGLFLGLFLINIAFVLLNVGLLGVILGLPSLLMSSIFIAAIFKK